MNEFQTYEFTTRQKTYGMWIIKKLMLILLYVSFVSTALVVGFLSRIFLPFFALIPILTYILVFFTWRYVSVEYEYSMTSGHITFSKIYGSRSRRCIFEAEIKSMSLIAPYTDEHIDKAIRFAPTLEYNATSSPRASEQYFALFEDHNGKKAIFIFEATKRSLEIFKFYNPSSTVIERKAEQI